MGGVGFHDILPAGTVGRREETRECVFVCMCVSVEVHRQRRNKNRCGGVWESVCVRGTKACFTELNNRSP